VTAPAYTCRSTLLKKFARSAAHAKAYIDGGETDETLSLRLGLGTHALLLPNSPPVVVYRGGTLMVDKVVKGKKGAPDTVVQVPKEYSAVRSGAMWEAFEAEHKARGAIILNERELATAEAMAAAIRSDIDADRLLFAKGTRYEHRIEWEMKGRRCSGTIDAFGPLDGDALVDLKSTVDASPAKFPWQARKLGYAAQLAFYLAGLELAGHGRRVPYIVAVENAPPFNVQVYQLTAADIDEGRWQVEAWLEQLLECERTNTWPAYSDGILPLNVGRLGPPVVDEADDVDEDAEVAA
jgi:hypothetical protein